MKVREFCSRIVVVAAADTDLREAAVLMRDNHVGALVVIDDNRGVTRPIGIVTDRDIVIEVVAESGVAPESLTVRDIMATNLATVEEDGTVFEAIEIMRDRGARRLPVVRADGRLVGMLSLDDVVRVLALQLGGLADTLRQSAVREIRERHPIAESEA